jgi:hypothetical protein
MARKLVVEIIADPRQYTKGLNTAAKETKVFGAEIDKATRGIISGSGALHGFGRSLAFASGGFLAFAGGTKFLEDSVSAARDAGVAQRSLAAQIKASGESFAANQGAIQKASLSLEKFGFTSEDSEKALTVLERGTGNITKAISLQGTAADLARAKNIDLASAANVLAKVFGGQETALRRAVPGLDKNAHGLQLIAEAQQRLAGQAKAGTTEAEKFHAILHNTEVIIGTALLPTLNKFLESLGKWLQKMNESGRLQKDLNETMKVATGLFRDAKGALDELSQVTGSTKTTLELLLGTFAAFKLAKFFTWFTEVAGAIGSVGTAAEVTTGSMGGLAAKLTGLTAAPWVITVLVAYKDIKDPGSILDRAKGLFNIVKQGGQLEQALERLPTVGPVIAAAHQGISALTGGGGGGATSTSPGAGGFGGLGAVGNIVNPALAGLSNVGQPRLNIPGGAYGNTAAALTAGQTRAIGLAADPNNLALLRQQAQHDQAALDFAKKLRSSGRISNAKYVDEVTKYASDLQQTNSTISGILQTARQKVADAAKAAAEKQKQAVQALKDRQQAAREHTVAVAQLAVTRAQATPGYEDDLATQRHLVEILRKQLAADRQNVDLQNQLFDAEQAVTATLKQRADAASQAKIDAGNLAIQRAQLTDSLTDDLAATKNQVAILKAQHASATDIVAAMIAVKNVTDQIATNRKQAAADAAAAAKQRADDAKQAAADAKQRAKDAADAALAARNKQQFGILGLGPTGEDRIPGVTGLQKALGSFQDAVAGTFLDTGKTRSMLQHIRTLLSGGLGALSTDVRSKVKQILDDLDNQLKQHAGDQTKFQHISSQKFVDSLGLKLTPAQRRALEAGFSTVGAGGTVPGGRAGQFTGAMAGALTHGPQAAAAAAVARRAGQGGHIVFVEYGHGTRSEGGAHIVINGGLNLHGVQNVPALEQEIVRRAKARPQTRRGM